MRKFALLPLALACSAAYGQIVINPATRPTHVSPDFTMPAGKIFIDTTTIPKPRRAQSAALFGITTTSAYASNSFIPTFDGVEGAFRVLCRWSHASFDDPIVWPGEPGKTHLHQFWGNENTSSSTDILNMATSGDSTCAGGTANRTGYWVPVYVYHCPAASQSSCTKARDGEVIIGDNNGTQQFNGYYKTTSYDANHATGATTANTTQAGSTTTAIKLAAAENSLVTDYMVNATLTIAGVGKVITAYNPSTRVATVASAFAGAPAGGTAYTVTYRTLTWPPAGFRMIGGDASNAVGNTATRGVASFQCNNTNLGSAAGSDAVYTGADQQFGHIPTSYEVASLDNCGPIIQLNYFPTCWDGVNLYLPGQPGASHLAYVTNGIGCLDPAYPVPLPTISYNIHHPLVKADLDYYRLSSDLPETQGVTQAGSTTTVINLAASESSTANYYYMGTLAIGGQTRLITAYNSTTKVATVASAFSSAPGTGVAYSLRNPGGSSAHGDWVNGWDQVSTVLSYDTITNMILNHCLRILYDCHNNLIGNINGAPGSYVPQPAGSVSWYELTTW